MSRTASEFATEHFLQDLQALLRSPYALIHLESNEEERALSYIKQLADDDNRDFMCWHACHENTSHLPVAEALSDIFQTIMKAGEGTIFALLDAHLCLTDLRIKRQLLLLEDHCESTRKSVIFIGTTLPPTDLLDGHITALSMPLPDTASLRQAIDQILPPQQFDELNRDMLIRSAQGLRLKEARRAFHRVGQQWYQAQITNQKFDIENAILKEKQRLVARSEGLQFYPIADALDDVGGLDALKQWLSERANAFSHEAREFGLPGPRGLLLLGVQGCGKSLMAKAVASHWGLPLLRLDMGVIFDGSHAPERALRQALKTCEAVAPSVLWMDEIDKGLTNTDGDGQASRVLASILTWQQEKAHPVFLVATANDVQSLPPELLRKGRFDEVFFVDLPDIHERRDILSIHLKKRAQTISTDIIDELAQMSEYFSGAELEQIIVSAMYAAFHQSRPLDRDDLLYACRETVPLYRTYEERIKILREWAYERARPASRDRQVADYFQ